MPKYYITANKIYPEKEKNTLKHYITFKNKASVSPPKCMLVLWMYVTVCERESTECIKCLIGECEWWQTVSLWVCTSLTRWIIGWSQSVLTSQWLSKKVKMEAEAVLAPRTRDRIRPEKKHKGEMTSHSETSSQFDTLCWKGNADMKLKQETLYCWAHIIFIFRSIFLFWDSAGIYLHILQIKKTLFILYWPFVQPLMFKLNFNPQYVITMTATEAVEQTTAVWLSGNIFTYVNLKFCTSDPV